MGYSAKILADSLSPNLVRLTTLEITFPRIVLAEFNTHRVFSRNSASSRAIPIEKMLKRVEEDPFIPVSWGKNQKGMQAEEELSEIDQLLATIEWLQARDVMMEQVRRLQQIGVHKQISNRLLEPFLWHTVIVSSTEWENWTALRRSPSAQPEIQVIANLIHDELSRSVPVPLTYQEWHMPLVPDYDALRQSGFTLPQIIQISVGRCTRVSYLTHHGVRDPAADIELCNRLLNDGHMSPFEHVARPFSPEEWEIASRNNNYFSGNFKGFKQVRKLIPNEDNFGQVTTNNRSLTDFIE